MRGFLSWIENYIRSFYQRIERNTSLSEKEISFYRIFVGLFFLFSWKGYSWLSDVPPGFFRPHVLTPARLFDNWPSSIYFFTVDAIYLIFLALAILGIRARFAFLGLFIFSILNNSFVYSFGKIDHGIFSSLIFLLLFFTNSGSKYAFFPDKKWKTQSIATAVFSLCLVFAFFTAGYEKALNWVDLNVSTSGILSWFYGGYFNLDRQDLLAPYFFDMPLWTTEIMDYSAVVFEVSGILFLMYSRRSWHLFLSIAVMFHLVNTLILNIPFLGHLPVYGIWLLSPFFLKYKFSGVIFLILLLLMNGLTMAATLWTITTLVILYSWNKGLYKKAPDNCRG